MRATFRVSAVTDQRDHQASGAGARGATRAVEVGLAVFGGVEVDDAGDAVDVDAARGDVGGDERLDAAHLEGRERTVALVLRSSAVDGGRAHAGPLELGASAGRRRAGSGRTRSSGRPPGRARR